MANSTGMQINSVDIPAPMDERGTYAYTPGEIYGRNGEGDAITDGSGALVWTFSTLTRDQWIWWTQTVLSSAASIRATQAKLYDHDQTLRTWTNAIVNRPNYSRIENGIYYDVQIRIEQIR